MIGEMGLLGYTERWNRRDVAEMFTFSFFLKIYLFI